jgi:o-succinylbenzoate synthase
MYWMDDLASWKLYRYDLPYTNGQRSGLFVQLCNKLGKCGWGEIAPLPSLSYETLDQAHAQVKAALTTSLPTLYPSVSFGLSSAYFQLSDSQKNSSLPLSALLTGSSEEILSKAKKAAEQGFLSAKVKIAHLPTEEALFLLKTLKQILHLRIDLNRSWTLKKAEHFFSHFSPNDFDYIEEPLANWDELAHFPFPFALDESLREKPIEAFASFKQLKALVIKPTLLGSPDQWQPLLGFAKQRGIAIVLSGVYETGIGTAAIASLIVRLNLPPLPLGLDTYSHLGEDVLERRLDCSNGKIFPHYTFNEKSPWITPLL